MHEGMEVTPIDLCWLMITISDNMATNMLIDLLGIDNIQANNERLGLTGCKLSRKLFEKRPEFRGLRNYISGDGIGKLLEMLYKGEVVSEEASKEMVNMMLHQQCTNKIPLLLPGEGRAAHKTGEDSGITHDTGILFAKKPFVVCFCNWQLPEGDEGKMNVQIGQITRELWDAMGGEPDEEA
jgi:beta-lactamase class A